MKIIKNNEKMWGLQRIENYPITESLSRLVIGRLLRVSHEIHNNVHQHIPLNLNQTMWNAEYGKIKRKGLKKLIHKLSEYIIRKTQL